MVYRTGVDFTHEEIECLECALTLYNQIIKDKFDCDNFIKSIGLDTLHVLSRHLILSDEMIEFLSDL